MEDPRDPLVLEDDPDALTPTRPSRSVARAAPPAPGHQYPAPLTIISFPPSNFFDPGGTVRNSLSLLLLAAMAGCGGGSSQPPEQPKPSPFLNIPMATPALSGQKVAVLPLTLAVPDLALSNDTLLSVRTKVLPWADSLVLEALTGRAPEVTWVGPRELRRAARRATGLATDPDHMGHAVLRDPLLKVVPDPLRSQIRTLVALVDARYALVPASAVFLQEANGNVKVELKLVIVDARTGVPAWRSIAVGSAATPAMALRAALAAVLPVAGVQ